MRGHHCYAPQLLNNEVCYNSFVTPSVVRLRLKHDPPKGIKYNDVTDMLFVKYVRVEK